MRKTLVLEQGKIREMRLGLNITLKKLGQMCGLATPTIAQMESREVEGKVTIETLRKIAGAMNCELQYALVPKSSPKTFMEKAAYEKAKRILESADLHMSLENQQVSSSIESRILKLKKKLLETGDVW